MPGRAITSTGAMAIGGSANRATLTPRATRSVSGQRTNSRAAANARTLPARKPRLAACTVAATWAG